MGVLSALIFLRKTIRVGARSRRLEAMTEERVLRLNLPEKASHVRIILHFKDAQGVIIDKCVGVVLREDLELAPPKDFLKDCPLDFAGCKSKMKEAKHG